MLRLLTCLLLLSPVYSFARAGAIDDKSGKAVFNHKMLLADSDLSKNITSKLTTYFTGHIAEQTYLHFDKPYYMAGDTIYFKAYVTGGESHLLSDISGVLHVDLLNEDNNVKKSIKLQLTGGIAWGDFALPDSLPKGNYQIRAYTNWMLNSGLNNYFNRVVPIGSLQPGGVPEVATTQIKTANMPDVQFLPESGKLINGLECKVAFKAVGSDGMGIDIKGQILDNQNTPVTTFASTHLGMGSFVFAPEQGKTYKAKITYPDGSTNMVNLPIADQGFELAVDNDTSATTLLKITVSDDFYKNNKDKNFTIAIYSGGDITAYNFKLNYHIFKFSLSKKTLHTGIASITIFSPDGEPLNQRLFFVQNNDQLKISTNSDKPVYAKREKVNLFFNIKNKAPAIPSGHFSVSVTDEDIVPVDENKENTIFTKLLLTDDLKGYIEQPNYYFTNMTAKTVSDLDLVMLTHGYHRFEWKRVLGGEPAFTAYKPEKALNINGVVKSTDGKLLTKGTVSLLPVDGGPMLTQDFADDGTFKFTNIAFLDDTRFIIKTLNQKNTSITITNDQPITLLADTSLTVKQRDASKITPAYSQNRKEQLDEIAKYKPLPGTVLNQIDVKDKNYLSSKLGGAGNADQVVTRADIPKTGGAFSTVIGYRLHGVKFLGDEGSKNPYIMMIRSPKAPTPMLVVLDGTEIDLGSSGMSLDALINVDDIEAVEVLTSAAAANLYGMRGGVGVLVITTRRDKDGQNNTVVPGALPVTLNGFYKARGFYSPKYDHVENAAPQKDLRSTTYWNPELVTDKDGNISVSYYNADGTGNYRVVIEGIDDKGNLGRQVYRYKVQ